MSQPMPGVSGGATMPWTGSEGYLRKYWAARLMVSRYSVMGQTVGLEAMRMWLSTLGMQLWM